MCKWGRIQGFGEKLSAAGQGDWMTTGNSAPPFSVNAGRDHVGIAYIRTYV